MIYVGGWRTRQAISINRLIGIVYVFNILICLTAVSKDGLNKILELFRNKNGYILIFSKTLIYNPKASEPQIPYAL